MDVETTLNTCFACVLINISIQILQIMSSNVTMKQKHYR